MGLNRGLYIITDISYSFENMEVAPDGVLESDLFIDITMVPEKAPELITIPIKITKSNENE